MPKITYFEYRPGRWVKMVDGQAVGPAKPDEVAQWQREQAAQNKIWRDVVQEAAPSPPEGKATPKRQTPSTSPEDAAGIWQDVVTKADAPLQADRTKPAPAEPGAIWQDVVQRLASAPSPPKLQPQEVPSAQEPAAEEPPAPLTLADAMEVARRGKPVVIRGGKVAGSVGKVTPPAQPAPVETEKETLSQAKIESMPKRPSEPKSTAGAAPTKPTPETRAPAKERMPKPAPDAKAPAEETTAKPSTKPAPKAKASAKKPAPKSVARPAPEAQAPAKEVRAEPVPKHRASTAVKRARKPPTAAPEEEASPSYLWIVAAPTDDMLAAIRSGLARYQERFGEPAGTVLCHAEDLPGLEGARLPVDLREGRTLPRRNFWIGPK